MIVYLIVIAKVIRPACVTLFSLLLVVLSSPGDAQNPPGSWLDSGLKPWNKPGMELPRAPNSNRSNIPPICKPLPHRTETSELRAVTEAGWLVFTSMTDGHGITVVGASGNLDGMCRPTEYQDFVFLNGEYAGTLSP